MTDLASTIHVALQEAHYETWLVAIDDLTAICFEDEAIIGFATVFEDADALLTRWKAVETSFLARYAPRFIEAPDKAWNVYSVFMCSSAATPDQRREIRRVDENLEKTRKLASCGLNSREEVIAALLPILPIQNRPRLEGEDVTERLRKRIATIAPSAVRAALDETISPNEVVRLLGAPL
jgi:hypothetical protein